MLAAFLWVLFYATLAIVAFFFIVILVGIFVLNIIGDMEMPPDEGDWYDEYSENKNI